MKEELKRNFPDWCHDTETKFELLMSDDLDALMCYQMQKLNYGREVEYFVNSSKDRAYKGYYGEKTGKQYFYNTENASNKKSNTIVLDFSVNSNVKAWDNHIIKINNNGEKYNKLSANANITINKNNYTSKFCISSFITMLSYYNVDVNKWTHDEKICLCAIDGLYQPFKNPRFADTGAKNLELLDMECLVPFIKDNLQEIEQFYNNNVKGKTIWINENGYMETNLDLNLLSNIWGYQVTLPKKQFTLRRTIESRIFNTCYSKEQLEKKYGKKIFNIALTYKNSGVVSFI